MKVAGSMFQCLFGYENYISPILNKMYFHNDTTLEVRINSQYVYVDLYCYKKQRINLHLYRDIESPYT